MNGLTRVFLVLLRLAIGWHLLFEGLEKIPHEHLAKVPWLETRLAPYKSPWTSAGYLRESAGPLSSFFRGQAGGSDEEALARLTVPPLAEGQDPAQVSHRQRIPPELEKDWNAYFDRFLAHYGIERGSEQGKLAQVKLDQAKENAVRWLLGLEGTKEVEVTFPSTTVKVQQTPLERINAYRGKVQQIRDIQERELPAFERDVQKQRLRTAKAEAARMRADLLGDLDSQLKESLNSVLTDEQRAQGPVPAPRPAGWLPWIDTLVMYGLTVTGLCLLLGLFTRTACVAGAAFLLSFYLALPALPGMPENLRAEGYYLYVNKNIIELLALLTLATTRSGYWVGLDGLVQFLNPFRWRSRSAAPERGARPV